MSAYRLPLSDGEPVPNQLRRPKRSWRRFLLTQLTTLSLFLMIALLAAIAGTAVYLAVGYRLFKRYEVNFADIA